VDFAPAGCNGDAAGKSSAIGKFRSMATRAPLDGLGVVGSSKWAAGASAGAGAAVVG